MKLDPKIYQRNMEAMRFCFVPLAEIVDQAESYYPYIHETPDGEAIWRSEGESGPWVHSRRAPQREIDRLLSDFELSPTQMIVLMSVGCGLLVRELMKRYPGRRILAIESNPSMIKTMLELSDFSKEIRAGEFYPMTPMPGQPLGDLYSEVADSVPVHGFGLVQHMHAKEDPAYLKLFADFGEWAEMRSLEKRSQIFGTRDSLVNCFSNVLRYADAVGLNAIKGSLKGQAAVLIGAGPSLDRNIDVLKKYQDRVFVHAVSTALQRVHDLDIKIDMTNVVDWSHLSARYFEGIGDQALPLLGSVRAHPDTLGKWQGPIIMGQDSILDGFLDGSIEDKGAIGGQENNVAHGAFNTLAWMGADPIIFCGMDLAYSYHYMHASRTAWFDLWYQAGSRWSGIERNSTMIVGDASDGVINKDAFGNPTVTDHLLEHAARTFESLIELHPNVRVINATEGGRVLKGAENMSLEEAMAEVGERKKDTSVFRESLKLPNVEEDRAAVLKKLEEAKVYNESIDTCYKDATKALKRAYNRLKRDRVPESVEKELNKIGKKIKEWQGAFDCSSAFCPADVHIRKKRKEELEAADMPEMRRMRELAETELDYLAALISSHGQWKGILDSSLEKARKEVVAR